MTAEPHTEVEALQRALARHGISLPEYAARDVVEAVLSFTGQVMTHRAIVDALQWQEPDGRTFALQQLRRELLDEVTRKGFVPVTLPRQTVQTVPEPFAQNGCRVEISMTVAVRMPPVDREAAVKAGILGG